MNDFKVLLQAAIDLQKAQNNINKQIDQIKTESLKLGVEVDSKSAKKAIQDIAKEQQNAYKLQSGKVQLDNRVTAYIQNNTKLSTQLKTRLIEVQQQLSSVDKTGLDKLKNEFREVTTSANALGQTGDTVFTKLQKNSMQFLNYLGSATIIMSGINSVRGMIAAITDLDKAFISLRKVTDETEESYARFLETAITSAKSLGSSVSDIVEMTATWAKLGYTIEEASKLAEVSTVYANVGEINNTEKAVSDLVTVMKAYGIESKNAMLITDKFNEIANKYATEASDLGEGISNAASSLALAGNSLDQSLAMLTTMTEITQNASESGNALKILSMRLRGMKGELEALGEESEGIESISKIQTQILNLTSGKVNIFDDLDPTKFKSTYDIMLGISKVWKDMAETDQAELLEIIAGKQRGNSIAALLTGMSQAENVLQTSITSAGSAMREQEAYMKGIQYSTDRLKASFQELASNTIDSSWVKGFVDLANILTNVINKVGLFNIALVSLATALNIKNGTVLLGFVDSLVAKLGLATGAATTLSFALSAIIPVVAILGGIKVLDVLITTTEEQAEKVEALSSAYESAQSEVDSINKELESQTKLMNDLLAKEKLTYTEQGQLEELKDITKELQIQADIAEKTAEKAKRDLAVESADLINKQYGTKTFSPSQVNEYLNNANMTGNNASLLSDIDNISSMIAGFKKFTELKEEAFNSKNNNDYEHFKNLTDEITASLWENASVLQEQKANMDGYYNAISSIPYDQMSSDQKKVYDAYNNTATAIKLMYSELDPSKWNSLQIDSVFDNESIEKTKDELIQMAKSGELSIGTIVTKYENLNKAIWSSDLVLKEGQGSVQAFVDEIYALANATPETTSQTEKFSATLTDAISALNDISDTMNALDSAYAKLSSKEKIDMSDLTALQKAFGELDGFEDFVNIATDATSVTKDVQNAFDDLLTTYVYSSGILENVNDSTKDVIISQLELMGVSNAEVLVTERLAQQKQVLADTGVDVTNATVKEIIELANLETTSESTRLALVDLAAQKLNVNNVALSTSGDLQNLKSLMTAASATTTMLDMLQRTKTEIIPGGISADAMKKLLASAQAEVDAFYAGLGNNANYSGGSKTRDYKDKSSKTKKDKSDPWLESFNKELEELQHKREMDLVDEKTYLNKLENLNIKYFKNRKKYQSEYWKYEEEVYKGRNQLPDLNLKAFDELKAMLDHKREMGIVDEEYYYKRLEELYTTHFGKEKQSLLKTEEEKQNYIEKYRKYREEVYKGEQQLIKDGFDAVNKEISKYDDTLSEIDHLGGLVDDNSVESLALLQTGYKVATDKANALNEEIVALNKRYADGKIEEELYTDQLDNLTGQLYDASSAMTKYKNAISDYYKVQKENFEDDYENEVKRLENAHKDTLDALDKQLEKYKEIVDEKKKSLRATEDEYQYQKKLTEHNKTISDIQDELTDIKKAADQGDREAIKRRGELEDELAKAQSDLADTQHDHEVDLAEKALDEELDLYEKMIKGQIGIADSQLQTDLANVKTLYDEKLASVNRLYEQEKFLIENMASLTVEEFTKAYETIGQLASQNGLSLSPSFSQAMNSMNPMVANILGDGSKSKEKLNSKSSDLNRYLSSNGYNLLDEKGMLQLAQALGLVDVKSISDLKGDKGVVNKNRILELLKRAKFDTGGMVLTNGLVKSTGEDAVALVKNKEIILNQADSKTFKDFVPLMKNFVQTFKPNIPNVSNITNNNSNAPHISITIPIAGNADANTVVQLRKFETDIVNKVAKEILGVKRKS